MSERLTTNDQELIGTEDYICEDICHTHVLVCGDCIIRRAINKLAKYEILEEQGLILKLPCKVGDTVWELCKCDDNVYRIFPMVVKQIIPDGSVRWIKDKDPTVWNIYAISDYTDMYKAFCDFGKTVFLTKSEAEEKLRELEEK